VWGSGGRYKGVGPLGFVRLLLILPLPRLASSHLFCTLPPRLYTTSLFIYSTSPHCLQTLITMAPTHMFSTTQTQTQQDDSSAATQSSGPVGTLRLTGAAEPVQTAEERDAASYLSWLLSSLYPEPPRRPHQNDNLCSLEPSREAMKQCVKVIPCPDLDRYRADEAGQLPRSPDRYPHQ
jgi:hypothetical protein